MSGEIEPRAALDGKVTGPERADVFIVLEGPDMTYYGDAEIHGVYATREEAEARARYLESRWSGDGYDRLSIQPWNIGEKGEDYAEGHFR